MHRNRALPLLLLALAFTLALPSPAAAGKTPDELPQKYRTWLEEVELLISKKESKAFLALDEDYQRDGFIARFWEARDPRVDTEENEFRDEWIARLDYAREEFGGRSTTARGWRSSSPPRRGTASPSTARPSGYRSRRRTGWSR